MSDETPTAVADPVEAIGAAMRTALDGVTAAIREDREALVEEIRALRPVTPAPEPARDPEMLPGGRGIDPTDRVSDPIEAAFVAGEEMLVGRSLTPDERRRAVRSNYELARILMGAGGQVKGTAVIDPSERFMNGYRAHVPERTIRVADSQGRELRAMDSAESGYGADLIGVQYVSEMWNAARRRDDLVALIPEIPMTAPSTIVPTDAGLPEMLLVAENTASNSSAYTTSKTGSSKRTLTAKKFTIQEIWSAELEEDSIVAFVPFLRDKLAESAALHLGSAMYNGDLTNAGTGNINSDDADPADTRHYLAFDGIRHYFLVDDSGNAVNQAGAITLGGIRNARLTMAGANNSVNSLDNIGWDNPDDCVIVCDRATYYALMGLDEVKTIDRFGPLATIATGKIQALDGIQILSPGYATKTEADGKLSETASSNTKGQLAIVNRRGWLRGQLRQVQVFIDRIQGRDQFLLELYTRVGFQRYGTDVAAGVYNITV